MSPDIYIFDLGGVLIDLHVSRCMHAFEALMGEENMRAVLGMDRNGEGVKAVSIATKQLMADFEKGLLSPEAFVDEVLRYCRPGTTKEEVVEAWMAMLGELPAERLAFIDSLRAQGHPVYLLSNGNDLHFDYINRTYGLEQHFDGLFLSQKMHMSKPEEGIFREIGYRLRVTGYGVSVMGYGLPVMGYGERVTGKVIFIDDIEVNRKAAEKYAGWEVYASIDELRAQDKP